jgi:hypothetical protein
LACTPTRTPEEAEARQKCLLAAEAQSEIRANVECHAKAIPWDDCPAREDIMAELAEKQEKCR